MTYFLILVLVSAIFWLVRSHLSEIYNDYYEDRMANRCLDALAFGALTGIVLWLCTGMMVRNVWIDGNFKKIVVAEIETYRLVDTKSGDHIVIADGGKTTYEVEDLSFSDFGSSESKLRLYRYEADSWLGTQYKGLVGDNLHGELSVNQ